LAEKPAGVCFCAARPKPSASLVAVEDAGILDHEFVVVSLKSETIFTCAVHLPADAMFDGVFYESLQQSLAEWLIQGVFVDIEFDLEAVFEADMFECQ